MTDSIRDNLAPAYEAPTIDLPAGYLTDDEIEVAECAGDVATKFLALEVMHHSDAADVVFHLHAVQNIVMSRAAQRAHPETFPVRHTKP